MKLTAIIPDHLMQEVEDLAKGSTTTESVLTALKEWVAIKKLSKLSKTVKDQPLEFRSRDVAATVRKTNRRST